MTRIRVHRVGESAGHAGQKPREVEGYELDNGSGLSVLVWTYGATLVEVRVPDRSGRIDNVVLRHRDLADYEARARNPYLGATVGRFCRNIAGSAFDLDGRRHLLDPNEGGRHHLHGGTHGFDRLVWNAEVEENAEDVAVRLRLVSPDGDQGYPGTLTAETVYRVDVHGRLTFEHRATTDASTVVGFTNHAYWNLGGTTIDGHTLALNATRRLRFDADLVPAPGDPVRVAGTALDYTTERPIGDRAIDNFFVLDDPRWAAVLTEPRGGRRMRVRTDAPGIGVYSADGYPRRPRGGLCLETGVFPDAPNRPDFPSARLDPGREYRSTTVHEFQTDGGEGA
ncbi:galactose mutarotase [Actinocorallia sp. API 0066]|uniref:aldose epimerase family protein n=1 Tax=Actinocorallia sp. API 0066 TaxID=2896846 RepID=UPI001E33BF58|nr:aldose epimerase family protein [Actinocorallia sp. API 0066]MCD0451626.1 galactose mutarotase [Actinocorallia sp. API 0066]